MCAVDPCIFSRRVNRVKKEFSLIVGVYIDDLILIGKPDDENEFPREHLDNFSPKNFGVLPYYIRCEYQKNFEKKTRFISQTSCAERRVQRFSLSTMSGTPTSPTFAHRSS